MFTVKLLTDSHVYDLSIYHTLRLVYHDGHCYLTGYAQHGEVVVMARLLSSDPTDHQAVLADLADGVTTGNRFSTCYLGRERAVTPTDAELASLSQRFADPQTPPVETERVVVRGLQATRDLDVQAFLRLKEVVISEVQMTRDGAIALVLQVPKGVS